MSHSSLSQLDDLEIYIQCDDLEKLESWLSQQFEDFHVSRKSKKGCKFICQHQNKTSHGMIVLNAGHTGFTSIWIDSRHGPWDNDVAMARAAQSQLSEMVRCVESAWSKGDDPDQWLQIDDDGENIIQWITE